MRQTGEKSGLDQSQKRPGRLLHCKKSRHRKERNVPREKVRLKKREENDHYAVKREEKKIREGSYE